MGVADIIMDAYAMESAILRTQKVAAAQGEKAAERFIDMTRVFCNDAVERIEAHAKNTLAAMSEGDELRTLLAALRRFTKLTPMNTIAASFDPLSSPPTMMNGRLQRTQRGSMSGGCSGSGSWTTGSKTVMT